MNQKQRILASDAPIHDIGNVRYKGRQPIYERPYPHGGTHCIKIAKGIPFIRVAKDYI